MLFKFYMLSFIFAFCNCQEHLTCLRTDDVFSTPPAQPPVRIQQGPPGKRGAIGAKGSIGQKGSKGDSGIPDNSVVDLLRDEVALLRQQVRNLTKMNEAIHRGYKILDDGWIGLLNGYQYKMTPSSQSWNNSRTVCQNLGGDLAVYGIQSVQSIWILMNAFSLHRSSYWIGLNDKVSEDMWVWVNGERAVKSLIFWLPGQPDNIGNNEDCGELFWYQSWQPSINDRICSASRRGICEKM